MNSQLRVAELADPARYPVGDLDLSRRPWPGEFRAAGGTEVFVRRSPSADPEAEPALYVHGLGGASTNFTDLAGLLSPYLDGHALDLPGFGRSPAAPGDDYSLRAHANTVIGYIEAARIGPVHLVGNSMGGAVSIRVAERRPDLIRTLTLVSPAVPDLRPHRGADMFLPLLLVPGVGVRVLRKLDRADAGQRAAELIRLCFAHPELVPENRLAEATDDVVARRQQDWAHDALLSSLRGIARMYLTRGRRSAWNRMTRIQAPSLVVWGELDRLVDVSNAPKVAAALPSSSLLVLPDVGHTAQLEAPVLTARAILALVARANDGRAPRGVAT